MYENQRRDSDINAENLLEKIIDAENIDRIAENEEESEKNPEQAETFPGEFSLIASRRVLKTISFLNENIETTQDDKKRSPEGDPSLRMELYLGLNKEGSQEPPKLSKESLEERNKIRASW